MTEYRKDPRVSQSTLKNYWISPRCGDHFSANPKKQSAAMELGTIVHDIVLLGAASLDQYRTDAPVNDNTKEPYQNTSKKYKDWKAQVEAEGCTAANPATIAKAQMMAASLTPRARQIIAACDHVEEPIYWEQDGIQRKGRPDAWKSGDYLVEIKTTRHPLTARALQRVVMSELYDLQTADYRSGIGGLTRTCIIWITEAGGGDCAVTWLNEKWLEGGQKQVERALKNYALRGQSMGQAPEEIEIPYPDYLEEFTLTSEETGEEIEL